MAVTPKNRALANALMGKSPPTDPYSPLEDYPEYAQAIGMISIELANLETALGSLLGSLLHISVENGRLVYLSPQTASARLSILENLHTDGTGMFKKGGRDSRQLGKMLVKARELIGKRNFVIHQLWGITHRGADDTYEEQVATRPLPFKQSKPSKMVPLSELSDLLSRIRKLSGQVVDATALNYDSWPPYSPQPKSPLQFESGQNQTPDSPQKGTVPKPKAPQKPSQGRA